MLKSFKYTKANGEVSYRTIYPLGVNEDKLMGIDVSDLSSQEMLEVEEKLDKIKKAYLQAIYDAGFKEKFRQFFMNQME